MSGPASPSPSAEPPVPPAPTPAPSDPLPPAERFEATVHADASARARAGLVSDVSDLDLDRVPDPDGGVRVLVGQDEISRLVAQGFEVRLQRAVPVRPLDPSLIATDADVDAWYAARMSGAGEN